MKITACTHIFVLMQLNHCRILIVCNRVPFPLKDGGALAMYAMIKGLHHAGYQVYVLAMNTTRHKVAATDLPALFREIAGFEMVDFDNELRLLPLLKNYLFGHQPQHAERFYTKAFEQKLLDLIAKIQPDIIQLESIYLSEYVPAIRQLTKAKLIQRLHNIEAEIWQRLANETPHVLKRIYLKNLAKRISKYELAVWNEFDALITISKSDTAFIEKSNCPTPLLTLPYGIDVSKATNDIIPEPIRAYHIGAMDWQPNVDAMEWMRDEIVPTICRLLPDFAFQFAGRNMPQSLLSYQSDSFCCVGEVDDAEAFMADKNILIVPLRSGSGIRVKTLEAMAAQKMVISTDIGMQGIEAVDKVHFLKANSSQDFADALVWCSRHPEAMAQIAQNAWHLIQTQYNSIRLIQSYQEFVKELS